MEVGLFDMSPDAKGGGGDSGKSGVDRNYGASAATSAASSGEITSSRTTISPVSNSLSPYPLSHCTLEPFAGPARGRNRISASSSSVDPSLKSHFERTCLFLYFQCPNFVERRFAARTLTSPDVDTRFLSSRSPAS